MIKRQDSYERTAYKIARYAMLKDKTKQISFGDEYKDQTVEIIFLKELIAEYSSGIIREYYKQKMNEYIKSDLVKKSKLLELIKNIFLERGYTTVDYSELIFRPNVNKNCRFYKMIRSGQDILVLSGLKKYKIYQLMVDKAASMKIDSTPDEIFNNYEIGHSTIMALCSKMTDEFIRTDIITKFLMETNGVSSRTFRRIMPKLMAFYGYSKFIGKDAQSDGRYESNCEITYIYRKTNSQITLIPLYLFSFKKQTLYESFLRRGTTPLPMENKTAIIETTVGDGHAS